MRGQEVGSDGPFLACQTDFCHLNANVSKTVSLSITYQLEFKISLTGAF